MFSSSMTSKNIRPPQQTTPSGPIKFPRNESILLANNSRPGQDRPKLIRYWCHPIRMRWTQKLSKCFAKLGNIKVGHWTKKTYQTVGTKQVLIPKVLKSLVKWWWVRTSNVNIYKIQKHEWMNERMTDCLYRGCVYVCIAQLNKHLCEAAWPFTIFVSSLFC